MLERLLFNSNTDKFDGIVHRPVVLKDVIDIVNEAKSQKNSETRVESSV